MGWVRRLLGRWRTVGTFAGFEPEMLLGLEDGRWWIQENCVSRACVAFRPLMEVFEGPHGYEIGIAGHDMSACFREVQPVSTSVVLGIFRGWSGFSFYRLADGEVWEQADATRRVRYVLRPQASVFRDRDRLYMEAGNTRAQVRRRRLPSRPLTPGHTTLATVAGVCQAVGGGMLVLLEKDDGSFTSVPGDL